MRGKPSDTQPAPTPGARGCGPGAAKARRMTRPAGRVRTGAGRAATREERMPTRAGVVKGPQVVRVAKEAMLMTRPSPGGRWYDWGESVSLLEGGGEMGLSRAAATASQRHKPCQRHSWPGRLLGPLRNTSGPGASGLCAPSREPASERFPMTRLLRLVPNSSTFDVYLLQERGQYMNFYLLPELPSPPAPRFLPAGTT